jgi:hypothetical protein
VRLLSLYKFISYYAKDIIINIAKDKESRRYRLFKIDSTYLIAYISIYLRAMPIAIFSPSLITRYIALKAGVKIKVNKGLY